MQVIPLPSHGEWLEARMERIGGSDAPAVMGLSKRMTRIDLALEKLRIKPRPPPNEAMEFGHLLEPIIRDVFRQRSGMLVETCAPHTLCIHDTHRFMSMSPDGFVRSDDRPHNGVLQIKKDYSASPWETVPLDYQAQVQHEMFVTGLDWAVVATLFAGATLQWYVLERHPAFQDLLVQKEAEFWETIKAGKVPDPDPTREAELQAYASGMLRRVEGKVVELPSEFAALHEERIGLLRVKKEAEARVKAIQARIQVAMGDAPKATIVGLDGVELRNGVVRKKEYTVKAQEYAMFGTNKDRASNQKEESNE